MSFIPNIGVPDINFTFPSNFTSNQTVGICDFSVDYSGSFFALILAIVLIVIGLFFLFLGARYFKYTLFGFSFLFGAGLGFYVVTLLSDCNTKAGLIVGGIMGLMIGAVTVKLWKFALFCMGVGVGFVAWTTFKAFGHELMTTDYITYGSLAGICILLGVIALKMEKVWLLIGTPVVGSFLCVQGIDHFIEQDVNVFQILNNVQGSASGCALTECYILYAMVIGLAIVGSFVQYRYTSEFADERRERQEEDREEEEEERHHKRKKKKGKKKKSKRGHREESSRRRKHRRRRKKRRRSSSSSSDE